MGEAMASGSKYHVEIRDARGMVIGDSNVVYQYFLSDRYRPLAEHFISFDDLIAERTSEFVGRAFVDARLAAFMEQHDRGYFVLVGEPGIGKTAWAAHVVQEWQALHHFNVPAMGIVRPDQCLENLCAQLIARFELEHPDQLPLSTGRDGSYLSWLLHQAAEQLNDERLVIIIDALDEVQMPAAVRGANVLYVPSTLPARVYVVATRRPQAVMLETAPGMPLETFTLGAELAENQADVRAYLQAQVQKPGVADRLRERAIEGERFVEELAKMSAGNFMYLAYMLPDIESGVFDPLNLSEQPQGLRGYYERFWNELEAAKGEGRQAWLKFYRPVIGLLAVAREPVSARWIGRTLGLDGEEVEEFALARWQKFLHRMQADGEAWWRVYHASFGDFLREELDGAAEYHSLIAGYYKAACGGDWPKLADMDGGYGLRHLAAHLAEAERWEELHELLAESESNHQLWAMSRHQVEGSYAGYLADLELAWQHADELGRTDKRAVGKQVRYALIHSTIRTLANSIPPSILAALVARGIAGWTPKGALDYALQIRDVRQRIATLAAITPHMSSELRLVALKQALVDLHLIEDRYGFQEHFRGETIVKLFTALPRELQHEALRIIEAFTDDRAKAKTLAALAPHSPPDLPPIAMGIAEGIKDAEARRDAELALTGQPSVDEMLSYLLRVIPPIRPPQNETEIREMLGEYLY